MILRAIFAVLLLAPFVARAENAPELVKPYAYRIEVNYDENTYRMIHDAIRREIKIAREDMLKRQLLSAEILRKQIAEELDRFNRELEAMRNAKRMELEAIERSDAAEAERWRQLRLEHMRNALELSERLRRLEELLVQQSIADWREKRRQQKEVADRALERLKQIQAEGELAQPTAQPPIKPPVPPSQ